MKYIKLFSYLEDETEGFNINLQMQANSRALAN
jgi:hypothetical protein